MDSFNKSNNYEVCTMSKLYLYVAETNYPQKDKSDIVIKNEISQAELTQLNDAFSICSIYHSITQIKNIVIENGESFKQFMSSTNMTELSKHNISPERAITLANKAVLNYASSIKTYIDMETRILRKKSSQTALDSFNTLCHMFYDKHLEYRFWSNFRNYIVHCEFPYTIFQNSIETGCKIICTKDHLLQFDNWKHSKNDIMKMDEIVNLPVLVDNMSSLIYALYIDFFSYFATEIIKGIETYGDFCRRYDVKNPVIFKTENKDKLTGNHIQPLPVNELKASFDILKNNPNISINIK